MNAASRNQALTTTSTRLALQAIPDTIPGKIILSISASLFVAVAAHVSVPVPFTPVPFTFSDLAVILVGLALGPVTAFSAMLLYLAEGAAGLPVFNPHSLGLFGPTGGYLIAYPLAALSTSFLRQKLSATFSRFSSALVAASSGSALLMVAGTVWLAAYLHLTVLPALTLGMFPFLPGQVVKVFAAAGIFASLQRWRRA